MVKVERKSAHEWEWTVGNRHHTVRYFASTDMLVWGGWTDTSNGPVFETGYKQARTDFLENGITHITPPERLLDDLRAMLEAETAKKNKPPIWKRWLGLGKDNNDNEDAS